MSAAAAETDLAVIGTDVTWPDHDAATAARELLSGAGGRLGHLEQFAEWLAGVQGSCPPRDLTRVRCVAFDGVHGLASIGGSGARIDTGIPAQLGIEVRVVDVCLAGDPPGPHRIRRGSGRIDVEDALSADEVRAAVGLGAALADEQVDSGADLLIAAVPGSGAQLAAATVVAVLTNTEPVRVATRGAAATDPQSWMAQVTALRDARRRGFAHRGDPDALLASVGGADLAAAAGFVLQAAVRRTGVLLDGLAALAAALLAYEAQPRAVRWWQAADQAPGPACELALTKLGLRPVLELGLGVVDGSAGALAVPVLRAAVSSLAALAAATRPDDALP